MTTEAHKARWARIWGERFASLARDLEVGPPDDFSPLEWDELREQVVRMAQKCADYTP